MSGKEERRSREALIEELEELRRRLDERERFIARSEGERRRLVAILENTSDLVSTSTPDQKLWFLNRAGKSLLGWAAEEEIIGGVIPDLHPPWAYELIAREGIPAAIERGVWVGETAIINREGREIPVSQVIIGHKLPSGELEYFSTIMRDMSEWKQVQERYRLAAQIVRDLIYEWNIKEETLIWVGDIDSALGLAPGEMEHTIEAWVHRIHPEDRRHFEGVIERRRTSTEMIACEYRVRSRDGGYRTWSDLGNPLHLERGVPLSWIGVCKDITERKNSEEEIRKSREQLQHSQKMEAIGRLAGGVAHELRADTVTPACS